ncbi:MAG: DUF1345 domain-containing protein [Oryzihumus sp.]
MTAEARSRVRDPSARVRVLVATALGALGGAGVATVASWRFAVLAGWMLAAAVFVAWMWATIWPMSAADTRRHACREDPGQATSDAVVLVAAVASLGAVALLLGGSQATGSGKDLVAALGVSSVALAWATAHTVFTARYARLYYVNSSGGVDFNEDSDPRCRDFAYLAFTVGMTFQVSDTDITRQRVRDTVLRHMLLSYLLGAVVIATTINLIAGLAK